MHYLCIYLDSYCHIYSYVYEKTITFIFVMKDFFVILESVRPRRLRPLDSKVVEFKQWGAQRDWKKKREEHGEISKKREEHGQISK